MTTFGEACGENFIKIFVFGVHLGLFGPVCSAEERKLSVSLYRVFPLVLIIAFPLHFNNADVADRVILRVPFIFSL